MNGIILINKDKNITSRDVVNEVSKIASGVLVLCLGKYTKLVDVITGYDKEYYATCLLGIETDTLDITGNIIKTDDKIISKEKIIDVLNSFVGSYEQEVPKYSAIKINGKKLYEYARQNIDIALPKRKVEIKNIKLDKYRILDNNVEFSFYVTVSKGTYIRSLIKDIALRLNTVGTMSDLIRIRQGNFKLDECCNISDIRNNNYKLIKINDIFDYKIIELDDDNLKKVTNGCKILDIYNEDFIMFSSNNIIKYIYKKDGKYLIPFKMNLDGENN